MRAGLALFYVLTNVTILAKCPLGNRHTNHQHMIEVCKYAICYNDKHVKVKGMTMTSENVEKK